MTFQIHSKRSPHIQAKLTIGQPGDKYEQEADAMADQVMRMPESPPPIQRKCEDCEEEQLQMKPLVKSISPTIQKQSEEEEEMLQMKGSGEASGSMSGLESSLQQSKGSGQNLEASTQSQMSRRIGVDFSAVKIHTDSKAVQMCEQLNATAFTHGSDIYFNKGQYRPDSSEGKHLLAHELTHTVQQGASIMRQAAPAPPERSSAEQIATTLRNASQRWGTDERAIFNALTGRTAAEIADIEAAYLELSGGETLEAMLRDELSRRDLSRALSLLKGETPSTEVARTLWDAMRGWGTDEAAIYAAVAGRTAAAWAEIITAYQQMTGNNLLAEIRDELNDREWTYFETLLPGAEGGAETDEDRATVIANQLETAMQRWVTDRSAIYAALTGHSETELREIERRYRLISGRELDADLRDNLTARRYERAQQLLYPQALPERLARSLHRAVRGPGTREAEIIAILQGRPSAEITQISAEYQRLYNESLNDRLEDELGGADWMETSILLGGRVPNALEEIIISTMILGTDEERLLAALETFNRDPAALRQLRLDYRKRTSHTLRADLVSELSGADLRRALFLINDSEDETAAEMTDMVGERMQWRGSGPGSGTAFEVWASADTEGQAPDIDPGTIINCWEVVLLAAYNTGAITWQYIHNLYTEVDTTEWVDRMSRGSLTTYNVGGVNRKMPQRGDVVFFDNIDHVSLATGNGSDVLTFWPPPDTPFVRNANFAVEDRVKIFSIEALNQAWLDDGKPAPRIQFARPAWK